MLAAPHSLRSMAIPALVTAMLLSPVPAPAQDRLGAYDFSYQLSGDARVKPVHVFDDGKDTFFQFRTGEPVPAIFLDGAAGARLLVPKFEGPYVKVAAVSDAFALRLGFGTARVAYIGGVRRRSTIAPPAPPEPGRRQEALPPPLRLLAASEPVAGLPREMLVHARPRIALEESSYATPLKGDAVEWMTQSEPWREHPIAFARDSARLAPAALKLIRSVVAEARPGTRFEVIGHDDSGHKESLAEARARAVTTALVSAGAAKASVLHKTTVEVRDAGRGLSWGVSLRVLDPASQHTTAMRIDDAASPERLRPGTLAPRIAMPEQVAGAAPGPATPLTWAVRKSDATLERMLERWARDAGWTLVWQGGPTVTITGDATLSRPDYLQAADYVVEQARAAGYRMRATAYSNQTLVISEE